MSGRQLGEASHRLVFNSLQQRDAGRRDAPHPSRFAPVHNFPVPSSSNSNGLPHSITQRMVRPMLEFSTASAPGYEPSHPPGMYCGSSSGRPPRYEPRDPSFGLRPVLTLHHPSSSYGHHHHHQANVMERSARSSSALYHGRYSPQHGLAPPAMPNVHGGIARAYQIENQYSILSRNTNRQQPPLLGGASRHPPPQPYRR